MPRIARIVGLGYPHHVVQRGNNKERIFFDKEEALRNCNAIVENQQEMISGKDERIRELEALAKKNFIHIINIIYFVQLNVLPK